MAEELISRRLASRLPASPVVETVRIPVRSPCIRLAKATQMSEGDTDVLSSYPAAHCGHGCCPVARCARRAGGCTLTGTRRRQTPHLQDGEAPRQEGQGLLGQ